MSKNAVIAIALLALSAIGVAGWKSYFAPPPVHTIKQAFELSCDDNQDERGKCHPYRVGGLVVAGSFKSSQITPRTFVISDGCLTLTVHYSGDPSSYSAIRPNVFLVAEGSNSVDGEFYSGRVYSGDKAAALRRNMKSDDAAYQAGCQRENQRPHTT